VLERVLDSAYENIDCSPDIQAFVDSQGFGRDDRLIPDIILKVYNSAKCHLDPDGWLSWCVDAVNTDGLTDASQTVWGEYLIGDLHTYLDLFSGAIQTFVFGMLTMTFIQDKYAD
jgi:hypothetical protein